MPDTAEHGVITHLHIAPEGGVPKTPTDCARIGALGLEGDKQQDTKHHGGPDQAVCLYSHEVIDRLRAEGHPISPGSTGENVTIKGLDWPSVTPGCRLEFAGGVLLEITKYTTPCSTIRGSFIESAFKRIGQGEHPGESRVYARVLTGGEARAGEAVTLRPA